MKRFRVGVIGCGRIAVVYLNALKQLSELIEVCFAVDKDAVRARSFAGNFDGCGWSDSVEDLLTQQLDVVHVLTPHHLHCEHAIDCLQAGFHVLTEKPIAITLSDADAMIEAARAGGKQLGVIFQNRYIEGVQEVKRLIAEGAFGKLTGAWSTLNWWRPPSYYDCDWKGKWDKEGGGVVIDQAIHSLDLVRYMMDSPVTKVQGQIDTRILTQIEVEDVANAAITFKNGAVYAFSACNYYTTNSPIIIEISGEHGRAQLRESEMTIWLDGHPPRVVLPAAGIDTKGESYWGGYHLMQIEDFYRALQQGRHVPTQPDDARTTLELVLAIYESSRMGKAVNLQ